MRWPAKNASTAALLWLLVLCLAGCATTKIDWNSRIGKGTYDETVVEIGPPDKQATLRDGTIVAEWITRRATHTTAVVSGYYGAGYYYPGAFYGPVAPTYVDSYALDFILRLTFGPDGKLQSWKKLRR